MSARSIHVHIEQLVLDGFAPGAPGSGARVADGVATELRRLIAGRLPDSWTGRVDALRGPPVAISPAAPERLGEKIAASIHRAVAVERRR